MGLTGNHNMYFLMVDGSYGIITSFTKSNNVFNYGPTDLLVSEKRIVLKFEEIGYMDIIYLTSEQHVSYRFTTEKLNSNYAGYVDIDCSDVDINDNRIGLYIDIENYY